jgi:hypothetical protein
VRLNKKEMEEYGSADADVGDEGLEKQVTISGDSPREVVPLWMRIHNLCLTFL